MRPDDGTDAVISGALIGLRTFGIVDNVASHWLLGLHWAVSGPHAGKVELALVILSASLLIVGLLRERRAHRRDSFD